MKGGMKIGPVLNPKVVLRFLLKYRVLLLYSILVLLIFSTVSQIGKLFSSASPPRPSLPEPQLPPSCEGRWIYIYKLDPVFNLDFMQNCSDVKKKVDLCPYMENGGMGRHFTYEQGVFGDNGAWHNTWQFSLEIYFHHRLLRYPCITRTEATANVFYVPFYAGMDLLNRMSHPSLQKDRAKLYMELLDWLRRQFYFLRNGGADHFLTLGRIGLDFRRPKGDSWGSQMLQQPDFQNMVKFTAERDGNMPLHAGNEIAVPYPSYYHPRSNADVQALLMWSRRDSQRSVLASIAGGRRRAGQGGLREKLMTDCEEDARCTVLVCNGHEGVNQSDLSTRGGFSYLPIAGHTLQESCNYPSIVLDVFHRSVFCLQPPGESPTRRSFIDSLIAGCIPVIFKRNSAWSQYTAFLPEEGDAYSVLIPIPEVRMKNIVHLLANIPRRRIMSMRENINQLLPRILYAHVDRNYHHHDQTPNAGVLERADAFDIALDEMFALVQKQSFSSLHQQT